MVQVNYGPAYGTMCASTDETRDKTEATTICKQLGYTGDSYLFYANDVYATATGYNTYIIEFHVY